MKVLHLKLLIAGIALLIGASSNVVAKSTDESGAYTQKDKEFYLTPEQILFIRPGLNLEILDIVIPADRLPLVTFSIQDPAGLPLDIDGITTPGPVDVRMMLTYIPQGEEQIVTYHERLRDRDGTYEYVSPGVYTYKFTTELPAGYEVDSTHNLGVVARRDLREFDLDRYVDNELHYFIPSGNGTAAPRDITRTATCNRCHDPLGEHGGRYQEVAICAQCHNPGLVDEGVSYSMDVMIHRVHEEAHGYPAPLNDCEVCHTGGVPTNQFPLVVNPSPVPVCDQTGVGQTTRTWSYPNPVELRLGAPDGQLMGKGKKGSVETGKWITDDTEFFVIDPTQIDPEKNPFGVVQELPVHTSVLGCADTVPGTFRGAAGVLHTNWMDHPSRLVCGSCHVDVNFETGENHSEFEFPQDDDDDCLQCHKPTTGVEYDRSADGAHTVDYKSSQLPGVLVEILGIDNTGPGEFPMVTFSLSNKFGPMDPADIGRLRFSINGPNEDFAIYWQEDASGALVPGALKADGDPTWVYTFVNPIPAGAMGSFTLGVEGRVDDVVINEGTSKEFEMEDQMQNLVRAFAVTDSDAAPRRMIVDDAKCESCHSNLSLHGTNRHEAQYCVTCHMPGATDEAVRSEDNMPPQSIAFNYMIHKIHRGEDLENGYVVLGYRSSVHDYSDIEYPGDLRNCDACHVDDSQYLPLASDLLDVATPRDFWNPMQPETAACLSCHDSESTAGHADVNTSSFGETCSTCHGEGKAFAVSASHAR